MKNFVENVLESKDFHYQVIIDKSNQKVIKLSIELKNATCYTFIDVRPKENLVLIYTVCPTIIHSNQRIKISEFITLINSSLLIGNFEFSFDDGILRYKSSFLYKNASQYLKDVLLKNLFVTFEMMNMYLPGVMSIIFGNLEPKDAINQVDKFINPSFN